MTDVEFSKLAMLIKGLYPKEQNLFNDDSVSEIWYSMLSDIDYNIAVESVKIHAKTNTFSPSIADIRKYADKSRNSTDWIELYQQTVRKIARYGAYREKECMESFDPAAAWIVRHIGYQRICQSPENDPYIKREFKELFEAAVENDLVDMIIETGSMSEPILRIT